MKLVLNSLKRFFAWLAHEDEKITSAQSAHAIEPTSQLAIETKMTALHQPASRKLAVGIEFYNRQVPKLLLWVELACIEVWLEADTEYRIESDETEYRLEFDRYEVTLWLQHTFGPRVLKRPFSADFKNSSAWEEVADYTDL